MRKNNSISDNLTNSHNIDTFEGTHQPKNELKLKLNNNSFQNSNFTKKLKNVTNFYNFRATRQSVNRNKSSSSIYRVSAPLLNNVTDQKITENLDKLLKRKLSLGNVSKYLSTDKDKIDHTSYKYNQIQKALQTHDGSPNQTQTEQNFPNGYNPNNGSDYLFGNTDYAPIQKKLPIYNSKSKLTEIPERILSTDMPIHQQNQPQLERYQKYAKKFQKVGTNYKKKEMIPMSHLNSSHYNPATREYLKQHQGSDSLKKNSIITLSKSTSFNNIHCHNSNNTSAQMSSVGFVRTNKDLLLQKLNPPNFLLNVLLEENNQKDSSLDSSLLKESTNTSIKKDLDYIETANNLIENLNILKNFSTKNGNRLPPQTQQQTNGRKTSNTSPTYESKTATHRLNNAIFFAHKSNDQTSTFYYKFKEIENQKGSNNNAGMSKYGYHKYQSPQNLAFSHNNLHQSSEQNHLDYDAVTKDPNHMKINNNFCSYFGGKKSSHMRKKRLDNTDPNNNNDEIDAKIPHRKFQLSCTATKKAEVVNDKKSSYKIYQQLKNQNRLSVIVRGQPKPTIEQAIQITSKKIINNQDSSPKETHGNVESITTPKKEYSPAQYYRKKFSLSHNRKSFNVKLTDKNSYKYIEENNFQQKYSKGDDDNTWLGIGANHCNEKPAKPRPNDYIADGFEDFKQTQECSQPSYNNIDNNNNSSFQNIVVSTPKKTINRKSKHSHQHNLKKLSKNKGQSSDSDSSVFGQNKSLGNISDKFIDSDLEFNPVKAEKGMERQIKQNLIETDSFIIENSNQISKQVSNKNFKIPCTSGGGYQVGSSKHFIRKSQEADLLSVDTAKSSITGIGGNQHQNMDKAAFHNSNHINHQFGSNVVFLEDIDNPRKIQDIYSNKGSNGLVNLDRSNSTKNLWKNPGNKHIGTRSAYGNFSDSHKLEKNRILDSNNRIQSQKSAKFHNIK